MCLSPVLLFLLTIIIWTGYDALAVILLSASFCFEGASVSALHCGLSSYRAVDICSLVHPVETCFIHQFYLQSWMELDVLIQGIKSVGGFKIFKCYFIIKEDYDPFGASI